MIYYKDLLNIKDEKIYEFFYESIEIENNLFIRRIDKADGYFVFYYDELDKLKIEYKIVGNMICPDCYTLEDVEVPFDIEEVEDVTNDTLKEGIFLSTSNDEKEIIKQIILPIVPIKVSNSK